MQDSSTFCDGCQETSSRPWFDNDFLVQNLTKELHGRKMRLEAMLDSKTVSNVIDKDSQTDDRSIPIDVLALRQSYDIGELDRIARIPGKTNPAYPLTKPILKTKSPLFIIMSSNKLSILPQVPI